MAGMYPHTMTWYKKTVTNGVTTYPRTVVTDLMWQSSFGETRFKAGAAISDTLIVYVPYLKEDGTNRGSLGFNAGDVIVYGDVADTVEGANTITTILAKYKPVGLVYTILNVDRRPYSDLGLAHDRLGAK